LSWRGKRLKEKGKRLESWDAGMLEDLDGFFLDT
jgi:hypothetical protein